MYGAVLSTFLNDPSQIGEVTPALAGSLGSYALLGMMVGALLAGAVGDLIGRRKVMLIAYAWFSVGMFVTALMTTTTTFGIMLFITGLVSARWSPPPGPWSPSSRHRGRRTLPAPSATPECPWEA